MRRTKRQHSRVGGRWGVTYKTPPTATHGGTQRNTGAATAKRNARKAYKSIRHVRRRGIGGGACVWCVGVVVGDMYATATLCSRRSYTKQAGRGSARSTAAR